jgi:xylanolytic transcriptional activator XlnR
LEYLSLSLRKYHPRSVFRIAGQLFTNNGIFSILGNVLEYHFIRRHKTFGANSDMVQYMRESTQRSLETWSASIDRNCKDSIAEGAGQAQQEDSPFPSESKLLLYGRHIFHSFFILLHGKMDLVEMFNDTSWLLSHDFLVAAEHAEECVKASTLLQPL